MLQLLIEDQIQDPNDMGVPAITITDEEDIEIIQQVMNAIMCLFMALQSACSQLNLGEVFLIVKVSRC